jgi:hypothetical protein
MAAAARTTTMASKDTTVNTRSFLPLDLEERGNGFL